MKESRCRWRSCTKESGGAVRGEGGGSCDKYTTNLPRIEDWRMVPPLIVHEGSFAKSRVETGMRDKQQDEKARAAGF